MKSGDVDTPWTEIEIDGIPYMLQPLGCEQAFELDAHLLHLFGEGLAAMLASGLEGLLPALLLSVAQKFEKAQSMEEIRVEWARITDLDFGDPEVREFIGRVLGSCAPKVADIVRETIPTMAARVTPAQARELVRICLFRHCKWKQMDQWGLMVGWRDLDHALLRVPAGHRRQMHKWALLIRAIQITWGPSGAAALTDPAGERLESTGT